MNIFTEKIHKPTNQVTVAKPSSYQHWTNKGPTSDVIDEPMSTQQWFYVQWNNVSDKENYKPAFFKHSFM